MSLDFEMRFRLNHEACGDYVEVSEDADGLGLVELRARGEDDKIQSRITLTEEQAKNLIEAVRQLLAFTAAQAKSHKSDP